MIGDALHTLGDRGFIPVVETASPAVPAAVAPAAEIPTDPAIVDDLMSSTRAAIANSRRNIDGLTGAALFDFILADFAEFKSALFRPTSHNVIMVGMEAAIWLNEHILEWLGEKNVADTLSLSAPNNVTAEMGLALLDVADVIRPYPEVIAFLEQVEGDDVLERPVFAPRWNGGAHGDRALPRVVRHALRRRDRHHPPTLERDAEHPDSGVARQRDATSLPVPAPRDSSRVGWRPPRRLMRFWLAFGNCPTARRRLPRRSG